MDGQHRQIVHHRHLRAAHPADHEELGQHGHRLQVPAERVQHLTTAASEQGGVHSRRLGHNWAIGVCAALGICYC